MPNYIVLRLTPSAPMTAADFTNLLTGLTINVFDISYAHTKAGLPGDPAPPAAPIGSATFVTPQIDPGFPGFPIITPFPPGVVLLNSATTIAQHLTPVLVGPILNGVTWESVATAVIPYNAPANEYPGAPLAPAPDLRIQFTRAGGQTLIDPDFYYDVKVLTAAIAPIPDEYQGIPDASVAAFVQLPEGLDPNLASVLMSSDGKPPAYDQLLPAVEKVLKADPGPAGHTLAAEVAANGPLTADRCRNIAYEILWGPQPDLPSPPDTLENMYTNPPNDGSTSNTNEQHRAEFEGKLSGFYALRNTQADRLTKFVFALSCGAWCRLQTTNANEAILRFPVNPGAVSPLVTVREGEVILTGVLAVDVPAEYFYALGVQLPTQITAEQRYELARGAAIQVNLTQLKDAVDAGVIAVNAAMNPAQAVKLISALEVPASSSLIDCPVASIQPLWTDWKAFPPVAGWQNYQSTDDTTIFWPAEVAKPAPVPARFLQLVLWALTEGHMNGAMSLADSIKQGLPVAQVSDIPNLTAAQWATFFNLQNNFVVWPNNNIPPRLPAFTQPGTTAARISAFIRHVQKFFQLLPPVVPVMAGPAGGPPALDLPTNDLLQACLAQYAILAGGPLVLGAAMFNPGDLANLRTAAQTVIPNDEETQTWLFQSIVTLNELAFCVALGGKTPAFQFSLIEALYARGFVGVESILDHTQADFQQALTGTVAYDDAAAIYARALGAGIPPAFLPPTSGVFHPINDGTLTNCIPPCFLSPLSPIAYLHEMLQVSESSTCDTPFAPPPSEHETLEEVLANRRGPVGTLKVTCANLDTPIPRIDLVNECLEFMASTNPPTKHGVVYDTSADELAHHKLCQDECCSCKDKPEDRTCHAPAILFAALPEYSTPGTPVTANSAVTPAVWNKLKADFSSCCLPYSQALDVNRTYLRHFHSCRYETMRTFRKCITEFVLDPVNEPAGFQSHLWRYPVRVDIAMEYLGVTPEEYDILFQGVWPDKCGPGDDHEFRPEPPATGIPLGNLPERPANFSERRSIGQGGIPLRDFLKLTCLSYCEFLALWKSRFVEFSNGGDQEGKFPDCEPCCLDKLWLNFPGESGMAIGLYHLVIFVRLWRKLQDLCTARYSFEELADICDVLQLFIGAAPNPNFIRQLAAFQILRDRFRLPLRDPEDKPPLNPSGADRTHLLALWIGEAARKWTWGIRRLICGIEHYAVCRYKCRCRSPEFLKLLEENLDPLSLLGGFDPDNPSDTWHAKATHTLRFAEVLGKIYASTFSIGEILFLFTADEQLNGDEPFALQTENESTELPLELPDDEREYSLWKLRRKLLEAHPSEEDVHAWNWNRIETFLKDEFGFNAAALRDFGKHFFPETLIAAGIAVAAPERQYSTPLAAANTVASMWNTPPVRPFQYDVAAQKLWTQLPLADGEVMEQLTRVRHLNVQEREAVRDLYFQSRASLAGLAFLFADFTEAESLLVEEKEEGKRWHFFQHQVALCHARCRLLEVHLSEHVAAATGQPGPEGSAVAALLLRNLFADENKATTNWEDDLGKLPAVTWTPPPNGGAYAALLGLVGTGLLREFSPAAGGIVWRDVCGPIVGFGRARNLRNCPVPTIIPALDLTLTPAQLQFASVLNGFGIKNADGAWLGGAQGFQVRWTGALLIEHSGHYEFCAGGPTPDGEKPDVEEAECRRWRILLKRGQRTWVLLNHHWPGELCPSVACLDLERGAYELTIEFVQPSPEFAGDDDLICPQRTGFQLKYSGPDSDHRFVEVPHRQLFRIRKDDTLGVGIQRMTGSAAGFLAEYYTSSLRDIRRTYQRAFKALLFAHRFALSATRGNNDQSELGYMLGMKDRFAGASFYRNGANFTRHSADFDFNFLPLDEVYYPPALAQDSRIRPSPQRKQAMFDWWERIFDYVQARAEVHHHCDRHLWLLFYEAAAKQPAHPGYLLRHLCADARHWTIDLRYYQDQSSPVYLVSSGDLVDDRWMIRAWHADRWMRELLRFFRCKDITQARPDLWTSLDPSALVTGEIETGNANLSSFLQDGCIETGQPRLYEELKRLNDGLRERGRHALLAYLCGTGGIAERPKDISDLLLIDVEAGLCERASRVEDAISAVQSFVQRARLGLEPGWTITPQFAHLWDSRFATFSLWEACKRRELYKENWVDWHDLEKAEQIEAFKFLESELRRITLTVAKPGGVDYWPDARPPQHDSLCLLQHRDVGTMKLLPQPRQGLDLLATPDRAARPTWLTNVPEVGQQEPSNPDRTTLPALMSAGASAQEFPSGTLPFWLESAIKLGRRFLRVAAAGYPQAGASFRPRRPSSHPDTKEEVCVDCCCECGCRHAPHIDEYYFWLVDARYFDPQSQPVYTGDYDDEQDSYYDANVQEATPWHNPTQLPDLLRWPANPMVRVAWCRVHNGEFQQPRVSTFGVHVPANFGGGPPPPTPDIQFIGRAGDSLYLQVLNASSPSAGFRYDLATDTARSENNLALPAAAPVPALGGLWAYPYLGYMHEGARLFPWSLQTPAMAVANALRAHCRYEAALKWYQLVYDPLHQDNTWVRCRPERPEDVPDHPREVLATTPDGRLIFANEPGLREGGGDDSDENPTHDDVPGGETEETTCCDSTQVPCRVARNRSILLNYLETLLQWSDRLIERGRPETFEQARLLLDTAREIMGKPPRTVLNTAPPNPQTVATFSPLFAPLNPRLVMLYEHVKDRLALIHHCLNGRRLKSSERGCCLPYWDDANEACCCEADSCCSPNPYRFIFLVQKAQELAGRVRELGSVLLAAFEKGDAEYLASIRIRHERELLVLTQKIRKDQWRDADWQVQALGKTKESSQANRRYYAQLIQNGLNNNESQYEALTQASMATRTASMAIEAVAEAMDIIPDMFVGFPCNETWLPLGTKLAGLFKTIARVTNTVADIENTNAGLHLTEGGWDRRVQEWVHQVELMDIQIEQIELQILGAERRRDEASRELDNQQRQIENSTEVLDFLRDKLTNHAVYLFLQKETAALYYKMYELALCAARQAQRAFNFERGHTKEKFLPCGSWDNLHEGFLAGERLQLALAQMEKDYLDRNVREYELTKHISLRLHSPFEFLRLKLTGKCEIQLPEWLFDLDYPGQFMRRIKNISLTIPCVAGPYVGVHCRLTLLCTQTRIDPALKAPANHCCSENHVGNPYVACCQDPRMACEYGAQEAIATSSGQNDSGLFELNFRDERYLPFEFKGAISRWRLELPLCNNFFDLDTLNDVVMHLNYTAREGGEMLREAANDVAQQHLPGSGWSLLDIRHDFPDAWEFLRASAHDKAPGRYLKLQLSRRLFPYLPCHRLVCIDKLVLLFETPCEPESDCPASACPCPEKRPVAGHKVKFLERVDCGCEDKILHCTANEQWRDLYYGEVQTELELTDGRHHRNEIRFKFPDSVGQINRVFIYCHYRVAKEPVCQLNTGNRENCSSLRETAFASH